MIIKFKNNYYHYKKMVTFIINNFLPINTVFIIVNTFPNPVITFLFFLSREIRSYCSFFQNAENEAPGCSTRAI